MKRIVFKYRDALSKWLWREQQCVCSSLEECIKLYGLGVDCDYEIVSVEDYKSQPFTPRPKEKQEPNPK